MSNARDADASTVSAPSAVTVDVGPAVQAGLTPREAEVVSLIAKGLSNYDISERLYISLNTVKLYIRGAYKAMDVTSRTQAVLWAIDHRLSATHRPCPPDDNVT